MQSNFNTVAFVARESLKASGTAIALGHVHQLLAAGLGYASLAALQASSEENPGLEGADYVILDGEGIIGRAASLGYGHVATEAINAIVTAIKGDPQPPEVFLDIQEFIDDVACRYANDNAFDDDAVASAAAETNAYFEGTYIESSEEPEPLKDSREFWEIPVGGNVGMDQDLDRPFSGDNILVSGVVRVWKAGRVCLMNDMELDIGASVDDSYYEPDDEPDERLVAV